MRMLAAMTEWCWTIQQQSNHVESSPQKRAQTFCPVSLIWEMVAEDTHHSSSHDRESRSQQGIQGSSILGIGLQSARIYFASRSRRPEILPKRSLGVSWQSIVGVRLVHDAVVLLLRRHLSRARLGKACDVSQGAGWWRKWHDGRV